MGDSASALVGPPRAYHRGVPSTCNACAADLRFLCATGRPAYERAGRSVRIVDLFSGCGGLTLGVAEAARRRGLGTDVVLAVDSDPTVTDVYGLNFPKAQTRSAPVEELFDGALGARPTVAEERTLAEIGRVDLLLAGPPCQGHSDLNNHTRRRDPRNLLYLRAIRAAQVLQPTFVVVENVPTIRHDTRGVVEVACAELEASGYRSATAVVSLSDIGVPQRRRRHVLVATRSDRADPSRLLELGAVCDHVPRNLRWAIGDLAGRRSGTGFDAPARTSPENRARIDWLFDNRAYDLPNPLRPECHWGLHSYRSMYGRLRWDAPAQTITTGFGSMGQGRYVHPGRRRTLTPHEAARLQGFPDFFDFGPVSGRGAWARMIGNAVPPLLMTRLAEVMLPVLPSTAPDRPGR